MRFVSPFLHWIETLYNPFIKLGNNLQSLFLLYMRLTWGHQFAMAGLAKLVNIDKAAEAFATLHFSHPFFLAYLVGYFEFLGGICLFVGFASRMMSIPLIVIMLTALSTAHVSSISHFRFIFDPHTLAIQLPYPYLIAVLMTFVFGPGRISIDAWIKHWSEKRPKY